MLFHERNPAKMKELLFGSTRKPYKSYSAGNNYYTMPKSEQPLANNSILVHNPTLPEITKPRSANTMHV